MKKKKWDLNKFRKEGQKWLESAGNRKILFDDPRQRLEGILAAAGTRVEMHTVRALDCLATWEGHSGTQLVFEGASEGWIHLKKQLYLGALATCLRRALGERDERRQRKRWEKDFALFKGDESNFLAHGMAFRDDPFVDWFCTRVIAKVNTTQGGEKELYVTPFIPFLMQLYVKWRSREVTFRSDVKDPMGVYKELFTHWDDPYEFKVAIHAACEYHCVQCFDNSGYPEFTGAPYDVCPMEILALKRVRIELGQDFPVVDHPLLTNNPFVYIPSEIPEFQDDLITRVATQLKVDYPELDYLC